MNILICLSEKRLMCDKKNTGFGLIANSLSEIYLFSA